MGSGTRSDAGLGVAESFDEEKSCLSTTGTFMDGTLLEFGFVESRVASAAIDEEDRLFLKSLLLALLSPPLPIFGSKLGADCEASVPGFFCASPDCFA